MPTRILEFIDSFARGIGHVLVAGVRFVAPHARIPPELVIAIGWLALLTAALGLAEVARKLTWVLVAIGWALVAVRLVMAVMSS